MTWGLSHRADLPSRLIADRHYNRQRPGTPQFVPPGRCLVLRSVDGFSLWVTSWPFAEFVKHAWAGCRVNSCFRREGGAIEASTLIREAVSATRSGMGDAADANAHARWVPAEYLGSFAGKLVSGPLRHHSLALGAPMVTFVDATKTKRKRDPGRCYRRAGFKHVGFTKGGLWAFLMLPADMPPAELPHGAQLEAA